MNNIFNLLKSVTTDNGFLTSYQEDLFKHDKNIVSKYKGMFIYAIRSTGTDIVKMPATFKELRQVKGIDQIREYKKENYGESFDYCYLHMERNTRFYLYLPRTGKLKEIDQTFAQRLHYNYYTNDYQTLCRQYLRDYDYKAEVLKDWQEWSQGSNQRTTQ